MFVLLQVENAQEKQGEDLGEVGELCVLRVMTLKLKCLRQRIHVYFISCQVLEPNPEPCRCKECILHGIIPPAQFVGVHKGLET